VHSFESAPREAIIIRARGAAPGEVIDNLTAEYQMAISNVGRCNIDREPCTYTILPPSPYQFFHVFDTKKEVIEEMISDEKKVL